MNLNLGDTRLIIKEASKRGLLRNQLAYVLATAYHETAHTMKPIKEMGGEKYLRSKKYWPFFGRGYVQITWEENYVKAGKILGVDFVKSPEKLLEPRYAAPILIQGMVEGWFTNKKLSDYITLKKSDFRNARRIVNLMDKADLIAGYAKEYDRDLLAEGYGVTSTQKVPVSEVIPDPVQEESVLKSKRIWTWLGGLSFSGLGLLDWRVQMLSVLILAGLAGYAIWSMPIVKEKISKLIASL